MTDEEWVKELTTYTTVEQVVEETQVGLIDHIKTPCNHSDVQMQHKAGVPTGLTRVKVRCSRGILGCGKEHNDVQALRFASLAFERIDQILKEEAVGVDG